MNKIYYNERIQFIPFHDNLYTANIPETNSLLVDFDTIQCLLFARGGILLTAYIQKIREIYPKINAENLIDRLIKQHFLLYAPPKFIWKAEFGLSQIDENEINIVNRVLNSKRICRNTFLSIDDLIVQPFSCCKTLENRIADIAKKKYCVVVNSCTSALECAFHSIDIQDGDEILAPTYNYIGAASAMMHSGGIPVLCDIDDSFMMNPHKLEEKITAKTKAILCTHLQGKMAQIQKIKDIANTYNLFLIEDCAQAFGVTSLGVPAGNLGDISCYSFHQHKLFSSGEGGAIVTDDKHLYERCVLYSDASRLFLYQEHLPGFPSHNYRMSEIHAAICLEQIKRFEFISGHLKNIFYILYESLKSISNIKMQNIEDIEGSIPQSIYITVNSSLEAKLLNKYLISLGIPSKVLYTREQIDHHVFVYWPYILKNIGMLPDWNFDNLEKLNVNTETLNLLSRTVSIPIGLSVTVDMAKSLADEMYKYFGTGALTDECN